MRIGPLFFGWCDYGASFGAILRLPDFLNPYSDKFIRKIIEKHSDPRRFRIRFRAPKRAVERFTIKSFRIFRRG